METPTILITDGQSRQALATARSLGKSGLRVLVSDSEQLTLAGFSRFVRKRFVTPNPKTEEQAFISTIQKIVAAEHVTMILPMTDKSLIPLARHRDIFDSVILPFPELTTIMKARDKSVTMEVAKQIGVAIPKTIEHPSFPLVLKPKEGSGSRGIRIVQNEQEFTAALKTMNTPFLLQERIPEEGVEIGCYLLLDQDHHVIASLLQKRLRSFPPSGGPSTLRVTMHHKHILDESIRLLTHINWVGPAMVEWKVDPRDGTPKLMEINPRFWGSLEGCIAAGVDFPLLTVHTFTGHPPRTAPSYVDGIKSHWMFPGDVLSVLTGKHKMRSIASFLTSFFIHDDIWSWRDPLPFFGSLLIALLHLFHPKHRAYFLQR